METRSMAKRRKLWEEQIIIMITETPIHILPNECLSHIFSFLNVKDRLRATAVCSRWRNLGSDAWRDVKELDLIDLRRLRTEHSRLISLCGRFLEDLRIPASENSLIINAAAANCRKLTKLTVRFNDSITTHREYSQSLGRLLNKNKMTLQIVSVENVRQDIANYIDFLVELPEQLVELRLKGSVQATSLTPFLQAIERLKNLETLELENFNSQQDGKFYDSGGFPRLKKMELNNVHQEAVVALISKAPELEFVRLCQCPYGVEVLKKTHEILHSRQSKIPLHIIVSQSLARKMGREVSLRISSLFTVEKEELYLQRIARLKRFGN